ncbi:gamma carbonic anhydrase family protein [Dethiobacter alkaliphilus]|uniref:gamma carbonic anhydrase family protein n=1 Tax=Dethiobacter alkaliphilus TaxID=427926 RepID=UPI00222631AC|nr:gamma carbonic anhydrase family protein [Dethiobacter alkaliphilus]MCW3489220.1 gamma carbonic anhydrase family protein [Dethiobacter alkaliphilus]
MIYKYLDYEPKVAEDVFLAPGVHIIGRVEIKEGSSIWFNTVVRGDINEIKIGRFTNIQDNSMIHVDGAYPTVIGDHVLVGHKAILHGCTVGDGALIGMGATLLDGAKVGENALVGAGALVREGGEIPAGTLAVGSPAKVVRELKPEEIDRIRRVTEIYAQRAQEYRKTLKEMR